MASIDLQLLARSFRESVAPHLPASAEVQRLSGENWLASIPRFCAHAGIPIAPCTTPTLAQLTPAARLDEPDGLLTQDWAGELVVLPGTPGELRLVRHAIGTDSYCKRTDTFAAARDRQTLETTLRTLHRAWRTWRREVSRVRSSTGRELPDAALDWSRLVLDPTLAGEIRSTVEAFAAGEALYASAGIPWKRGMLLHGPPGNGKTMLCRAVFGLLEWPAMTVTPKGDTDADDLRYWLDEAEDLAPSVLVLEDLDSLIGPKLPLAAFLNAVDGVEACSGVLLIATTNHPEKLDPAISSRPSRFDRVFRVGPPALRERERYLAMLFGDRLPLEATRRLAAETDGLSMAFLKELFLHAALLATARGEVAPSFSDVERAHAAVRAHLTGAARDFSQGRPTGFALQVPEEPKVAEAKGS